MGFNIGGQSSKSSGKSTTKLDPRLEQTLYGRIGEAQQFAANTPYSPLSAAQIRQYEDPYTQDVVDATISDVERARQIANVDNAARASAGGAWGGSRHGILDAETQLQSERNLAGILGGLRSQGYQQAAQLGQAENRAGYDWLLNLQNLLNQTTGLLPQYGTEKTSGKTSGSSFGMTFQPRFGG